MTEYVLPPSNGADSARLDVQHTVFLRTLGSLNKAPLNTLKPLKVLDVGCGNGNWAIAFAREHPNASVLGLDISASSQWTTAPPNCSFRKLSVEVPETWSALSEGYDYIHARMIMVFVRSWPNLLRRCYDHLAPSGWLEIQDLQFPIQCLGDVTDRSVCKTLQWSDLMIKGAQLAGLSPAGALQFAYILPRLGFQDVTLEDRQMFFGDWPESEENKELGRLGLENVRMGGEGWSRTLFTKVLGMSPEENKEITDGMYQEALGGKVKAFLPMKLCWARKP